jgi:hypothetical protein
MGSYRKIDDFTVVISSKEPASYFPIWRSTSCSLQGLWTDTWPPNSTATLVESSGGTMLDSVNRVERYRKEASRCAELAKEPSPPFLAEIYRKVAVRYVFMAEELLKGPARDKDAIERTDRMISRLRPDAAIEHPLGYHARGSAPAGMGRSPGRMPHGAKAASGPD